jgi:hypothetical protein
MNRHAAGRMHTVPVPVAPRAVVADQPDLDRDVTRGRVSSRNACRPRGIADRHSLRADFLPTNDMPKNRLSLSLAGLIATFAADPVLAQPAAKYPSRPVALSDAEEIALAASAAPAAISGGATIYGIKGGNIVKLREGRNAVSCMVSRDLHPGSAYPICFDAEGSKTWLWQELFQNELRARGESEPAVKAATADAFASGKLQRAKAMTVTYMMSPRQVLFSSPGPEGRRAGRWWPHLMIFDPGLSAASLGMSDAADYPSFSVDREADGRPQLIVKVPYWSDGSPAVVGPDLAGARAELGAVHARAATRAANGDVVGAIADLIAPQGFYVAAIASGGAGADAARRFLTRDPLNAQSKARWIVVRLDVSADGNDGYSYGYLDLIRPNGDTVPGAFKAYWRRNETGQWQALAFGRAPRKPGALSSLPDSLTPRATQYRPWPMPDSLIARKSLVDAERAFSDSSLVDIRAAFMSFAAPDAGKVSGTRWVFGPEAIGEDYRTPPPGFNGMTWSAQLGTVSRANDLGFNIGPVTPRPSAGQPSAPGGQFFTVWRRQPNGEWRYVVD